MITHHQRLCREIDVYDELVGSTLAVLSAIHGAGLFDALPAAEPDIVNHNDGMWLLSLLKDKLSFTEKRLKEIEAMSTRAD